MARSLTFAVPVEWDDTETYEVNMIVFVGKKAYTAIQDVPVGIAITNTSYWVETGVPTIDISSLQTQITHSLLVKMVQLLLQMAASQLLMTARPLLVMTLP